ncbi:70 kDa peptidyl-prolyl isomerase-like isoform X2 [Euphorbia lathyris]|uniref:70 kDa peptidyl-prolyl isomerase-like isoform X2 n=1 Tax=Euphorbia lathyris TaxID=212925 RepID=UPI003313C2EA
MLQLPSSTDSGNPKFPEKEIGNQGLKKRILKKGISWQIPFPGDQVQVDFSGKIEGGECFDSSIDKGSPFSFKLGQGEVIKGLDDGVATMKKGERAIFIVPPNLAYGEAGSPPLIPPNATLVFDVEMKSWITITDLTGDGGILKKITKEGHGWATPRDGDHVLGYLCPGLGKAVKTMRKGEKAELAVKSFYGLSENEEGKRIPPDSNLTIEIELVSWTSVIDITGDNKVVKKIVKAGQGFERPNEDSMVKVIYTAKLEDGTVFEHKGTNEEPFQYTTLQEHINEGLDRAIMSMKRGEHAEVTVGAEYVCGKNLPANSMLKYDIELIDFIKEKPFWKMDTNEKLEASQKKKLDGNMFFKAGKFWLASNKYHKASNYVEYDHSFSDDEKCIANGLKLACNLNNAACKLKLGDYLQASRLCTKVLEQDPSNVKALFRRAEAYLKISELEKAETDIKRALIIDPHNRDVRLKYKELKGTQREYTKHQTEFFSTMIAKMG